jgi:hypothetical protein
LHKAFEREEAARVYLRPLDKAGDLLALKFGPNLIAKLTSGELAQLVDLLRLRRINENWTSEGGAAHEGYVAGN